jgi:hypothetical protein
VTGSPLERVPEIVADFDYAGLWFQVVAWPETDDEEFEWDVVRGDVPYIWRHGAKDVRE